MPSVFVSNELLEDDDFENKLREYISTELNQAFKRYWFEQEYRIIYGDAGWEEYQDFLFGGGSGL